VTAKYMKIHQTKETIVVFAARELLITVDLNY